MFGRLHCVIFSLKHRSLLRKLDLIRFHHQFLRCCYRVIRLPSSIHQTSGWLSCQCAAVVLGTDTWFGSFMVFSEPPFMSPIPYITGLKLLSFRIQFRLCFYQLFRRWSWQKRKEHFFFHSECCWLSLLLLPWFLFLNHSLIGWFDKGSTHHYSKLFVILFSSSQKITFSEPKTIIRKHRGKKSPG